MFQSKWNFPDLFQIHRPGKTSEETKPSKPWPWKHGLSVDIIKQPRARRYLLRFQTNGRLRLVIPRRGNTSEALRFLERCEPWILKRREQWAVHAPDRSPWVSGTRFLFRGEEVSLSIHSDESGRQLRFADETIPLTAELPDYKALVQGHLRSLAERELPLRTKELARVHGITIHRITIRAQKTRWGSCSIRGTISLNWRLIQAPAYVVDYLIIHELMHRREMNHSARYWKLVAEACPTYLDAEKWLKQTRLGKLE